MRITMPAHAREIIETLQAHGYEAYIVGGCVRDAILGKAPNDWDITTSAKPLEVKALFRRTVDTGLQHGTVTVVMKNEKTGKLENYEVTTYRVDGVYQDHRRPEDVTFTTSLSEDLLRRDFTINAMAYNDKDGLVDLYDGIGDLDRGIIRCVGVAEHRFDEDALRILRAVRFAAQLGFVIEDSTKEAIRTRRQFLRDISAERIQVELTKLLLSEHPDRLMDAYALGITKVILPEFDRMVETPQNNAHHCYNVGQHAIVAVQNIEPDIALRWGALLHDVGKPETLTIDEDGIYHFYGHPKAGVDIARRILRRMKLDNQTIKRVLRIVEWHDYGMGEQLKNATLRKAILKMGGIECFPDVLKIRYADIMAQSMYQREEKLENWKHLQAQYQEILDKQECLTIKDLKMDGKMLKELGVEPGRQMGILLHEMLEDVLEHPEHNTIPYLTEWVRTRDTHHGEE